MYLGELTSLAKGLGLAGIFRFFAISINLAFVDKYIEIIIESQVMAAESRILNELTENKFRLVFKRLPLVSYNSQELNLPGISQTVQQIHTPQNYRNVGGVKLNYEEFTLTFKVDENLKNYIEIFNWLHGITAPQHSDQFKQLIETNPGSIVNNPKQYNIFSDATVIVLSNALNPNVYVHFKNMIPVSLTGLNFNLTSSSPEIVRASATFAYDSYEFEIKE